MDQTLRRQMMENYLRQQQSAETEPSITSEANQNALVLYNEIPENISMDEFKKYVKKWFECDNFIKKARELIKEKKKMKDKLSEVLTKFMCKYDIEDINTRDGRIVCKTKSVKAPVNKKVIEQKISDFFKNDENKKNEIIHKIYDEREAVEKVSLRRLRIT